MNIWASLTPDQQFTAFIAVAAAFLGGFISLMSSLTIFWVTKRSERIRAETEIKTRRKMAASIGLAKLVGMINVAFTLKNALDQQFKDINDDGHLIEEPALALRPFIGGPDKIEYLGSAELEFLLSSKSGTLVSEIEIFQRRLATDLAVLEQFNADQRELMGLLSPHVTEVADADGAVAGFAVKGREAKVIELRIGSLNRLIADMIETFDKDLKEALQIAEKFRLIAVSKFGEKFPKITGAGEQ